MKNLKLKYVISPVCIVLIAVVGYIGFLNTNNNPIAKFTDGAKDERLATNININIIKNMGMAALDADIQEINGVMIPYFEYMTSLSIPEDFDSKEDYKAIYVRSNRKVENYDILNNYEFTYKNTSNNRGIIIGFSDKYQPLRDYEIVGADKISKIGDTELVISQYNRMFIAKFTHKGVNFDIETVDVTQEELISLLESIILREQNTNIE